MDESAFRQKVYKIVFLFSVLVIWTHSYNAELFLGKGTDSNTIYVLEHYIGELIAQIAVPGFFMISSYLFLRNFTMEKLWDKWRSRIRSILVPYILWNAIYYIGYVVGSRIPRLTDIIGKGVIPFNINAMSDAIINYTYNYVFWYLYQLILLIILAPVIYLVVKNKITAAVYFVLLMILIELKIKLPVLNADALFYYSAAAYMALHFKTAVERERTQKGIQTGIIIIFFGILSYIIWSKSGYTVLLVICRTLVPMGIWNVIPDSGKAEVPAFMKNNFLLYALHFALVRLINKTAAAIFPDIVLLPLIIYIIMPLIIILINSTLSKFMQKYMKNTWNLLTGGR